MKIIILILILFSTFCFAQEGKNSTSTPTKPSTTDCPTWNKKKQNSKAAYFEYLRSPKSKENQQSTFSKPQKAQAKEVVQKTENTPQKKYLINPKKQNNL